MSAVFKPSETFRGDFSFRNSPQAIRRFPLPFPEDEYMYSVNIEPHLPGPSGSVTEFAFDVDELAPARVHDLPAADGARCRLLSRFARSAHRRL